MNVDTASAPSAKAVFLAARKLGDKVERRAYLDLVCGGHPGLREEVERLLAACEGTAPRPLDRAIERLGVPGGEAGAFADCETLMMTPVPSDGASSHSRIGPYKLLEAIGEGGMGTVYMAEQSEPVRRMVALKVIKPGMDSKQVIARFEAERQALAMMDHPNIARVLDAGTTENGRPYFVMELVRGIPITDYCDQARLSIPDRLELVILACRAVQHAHQKGIIHRDLKPSNILVTLHDGVPVPKVIDFGIAKATGQSLTEKTLFTGFAQMVGTPLYMSPEQAGLSGLDVDTRSDVYALGVLLYELLTGTTPFDRETFGEASLDEIRRIIREKEPPTPSSRLATWEASPAAVSAARHTDPRRLGQSIRGELDWIVMRSLEKDRNRRYESANALAADLRRHLDGEAVEAHPPSAAYRLGKLARRNRAALTTAAAVATALLAGTAVSTWQAARAMQAEGRATAALEESRLVVDYLVDDVFGAAAPARTRGRTPTIHDLLAAGEEVIPSRFGRRPLVEAAAREALGRAYSDLGRYDEAAAHFRRVAALRGGLLGPDHPDTLSAEALLVYALCPVAISSRKFDEAEPIARRVLEARRRSLGPEHPDTLASMTALAHVLMVELGDDLYEIRGQYASATLPGHVMRSVGRPRTVEVLSLLESAYAVQSRRLGARHPDTLATLNLLGLALHARGDLERSEDVSRRAAEGRRLTLGPLHPNTLQSLKHLGTLMRQMGRTVEATRVFLEVAEGHRQTFGASHIQTSSALSPLLHAYWQAGDSVAIRDFCERWLREILESPIDFDPYQRSRRAVVLERLALTLTTTPIAFDLELADRAIGEALELDEGWYSWAVKGMFSCRTGRPDEALRAFRTAEQQPDWAGGNDLYWFSLAETHARLGDPARAAECLERGRDPETGEDSWSDLVGSFRVEAEALLGGFQATKADE